jgi:hypothetical protein
MSNIAFTALLSRFWNHRPMTIGGGMTCLAHATKKVSKTT